ncbi:hypothetical protein EDD17DRAFT_1508857 [Pisolithus thermaeus]|nr:hypothetical protein EV401DRAFT_1893386 [Pisolithus croceorrhizus]KAI6161624.1 hypothetical protein EDD17DRAFT_1508857 [Pisolithus thermaeus]
MQHGCPKKPKCNISGLCVQGQPLPTLDDAGDTTKIDLETENLELKWAVPPNDLMIDFWREYEGKSTTDELDMVEEQDLGFLDERTLRVHFGTIPSVVESLLRLPTGYEPRIVRKKILLEATRGRLETSLKDDLHIQQKLKVKVKDGSLGLTTNEKRSQRGELPTSLGHNETRCGIPDTILGCMLHLKSPHEKWSYLENCFGRIPRPDSWLAAEQAMQQRDTPSEQEIARGTGQEARDSNSKIKTLPGSQNEPTDSPSDCAETEAGHTKPEPKVVDARHLKPYLRGVEVEAIDLKQPAEGMDTLEAPDSGSQCASDKAKEDKDIPMTSCKALEPQGNLPSTTSERAETRTGHRKPENEVADMQHMVDVLPMFEVGSTGQAWYSKHAKEHQAPDEDGQRADNKIERSRDLPKSSSKVCKPVGHPTGQAGERAMEDALRTSIEDIEHSRLRNSPSARAHSAMSMETNLSCTGRSSKRRETKRLELDCKQALGRPKRTYRGCTTSETPPDEAWGMGVYSSARVGWGDSTTTGSIMTTLEIRGLSARTVELRAHLPHWDTTRKEPDKAGDTGGRGDDTASKDFVDSHGVEKTLLAISRSQKGEREAKWRNGLPGPSGTRTDMVE